MINWAVIGTGGVATEFTSQFDRKTANLYAVYSRSLEKAKKFSEENNYEVFYDDYEKLLNDENIDIVYIATPHNTHYKFIKKALENKKNVLAEKSVVLNSAQLKVCIDLAEKNNLFFAEAMTIHYMPLYLEIKDWIKSKNLGPLKMIQVNFGSFKEYDQRYFFKKELAGGALFDIGIYAINFVRYFLSSKPTEIKSLVNIHEYGVDESSAIILKNKEKELATISLTFRSKMPKRAVVAYERGYIEINDYPSADEALFVDKDGNKDVLKLGDKNQRFTFEARYISKLLEDDAPNKFMQYTVDTIEIMDELRSQWNLQYDDEEI